MARVKGMFLRNTNYEVTVKKPLDARALVKTYDDLLLDTNWLDNGKSIAYNGMLVAVANTSDTSKNGLYFLFDINCTSFLKSPDVTKEEHWIKIGETSEIGDFAERISKINTKLEELDSRVTDLEERQTEVFGYRSGFPDVGVENKLYVAVDEEKSYVWVNDKYLPISGSTDGSIEPDVIYGGTAEY